MRQTSSIRLISWAVVIGLAACSSSKSDAPSIAPQQPPTPTADAGPDDDASVPPADANADAPLDPVAAAQACLDEPTAYCTKLGQCDPVTMQIEYGDLATCIARLQLTCVASYFSVPGTSLTPSRWEACAQATSAETCGDLLDYVPPAACAGKPGQLANGATCRFQNQCQSANCKINHPDGCGTCSPVSPTGGPCIGSDDCAEGQACSPQRKCVVRGGKLAPCDANNPCDGAFFCKAGSCATLGVVNDSCTIYEECRPQLDCVAGKCVQSAVAQPGSPCGQVTANQPYVWCVHGACKIATGQTAGVCVANALDGAPCDPGNSVFCSLPAVCLGGTCKVVDPLSCK